MSLPLLKVRIMVKIGKLRIDSHGNIEAEDIDLQPDEILGVIEMLNKIAEVQRTTHALVQTEGPR